MRLAGKPVILLLVTLLMAACGAMPGQKAGGFVNDRVGGAFIPVDGKYLMFLRESASAFVVEPGIAATNAHVGDFLGARPVIGTSRDYDLMFFRVPEAAQPPAMGVPSIGERVVAYGHAIDGSLRMAEGVVRGLDMPVEARCRTCSVQSSFVYEADAGPGFSGGPVVDAQSGAVVGITFGYDDDAGGKRRMYAYPMSRVRNELAILLHRLPVP